MSRSVQVIILCEDRQHEAFARRFLALAGRNYRIQRVEISPKGRGSGEQFVRQRFPKELAFYRSRSHRVGQALIVLIDDDGNGPPRRIEQLEHACIESGQERRRQDEHVAIFVPARNTETWLAYLGGQTVDEDTKYPRLERERDCKPHVEHLYEMCQNGALTEPSPPSLQAACEEYRSRIM